jgi:peroxiredoxin
MAKKTKNNRLIIILVALAVVFLIMGIATRNVGNEAVTNGGGSNGEVSNGGELNGGEPNGGEPNGSEPVGPDLSGLGLVVDCDQNPIGSLEVGDPAPDFRFQDAAGATFSLSDFRGRLVMLNFWATWCPYCNQQLPYVQQTFEKWPSTDVVLLTIDKGEDPSTVAAFMQDQGLSFPVLTDVNQITEAQYYLRGIPTTFFIDAEGVVQVVKVGYFHTYEDIEAILNQLLGRQGG